MPAGERIFEDLKNLGALGELDRLVRRTRYRRGHHRRERCDARSPCSRSSTRHRRRVRMFGSFPSFTTSFRKRSCSKNISASRSSRCRRITRTRSLMSTSVFLMLSYGCRVRRPACDSDGGHRLADKAHVKGAGSLQHTRIGKDCEPFEFYKFRTMYRGYGRRSPSRICHGLYPVGRRSNGVKKITDDPRVTPIGRFLRQDEPRRTAAACLTS